MHQSGIISPAILVESGLMCRLQPGIAADEWEPALDQSLMADSTLIYPKAQARPASQALHQSSASYRPAGSPHCLFDYIKDVVLAAHPECKPLPGVIAF